MTDRIELAEAHQACPTTSRKLLAGGALLIDVREPREVAEAGFDGCEVVNIPLSQLEARWQEVPRDRDVILACAVGARSLKATYFLMYKGYTRVTNMSLGMKRWMERGFPVTGFAKSEGREPAACGCASDTSATGESCCGGQAPAAGANCWGSATSAAPTCC